MNTCSIALLILVITIILFATELIPIPVTAVSSALAMGVFGVIPFASAFSGFSNDVTIMIIGAIIVGEALFETGVAEKLGDSIIKVVGPDERKFLVACVVMSGVLSAFLSDTAVVAMMLPVVAATAARSGGRIRTKHVYMAIGFAANLGGGMTLVGSTPNVIAQGLLESAGLEPMGFFDLLWGAIPRFIFMVLFYATVGIKLQERFFDLRETNLPPGSGEGVVRQYDKRKMVISSSVMLLMIAGFVSGVWSVGAVAIMAGLACIWTKCISIKQVFQRMEWNTVWVIAGSFGMAAGIDKSGAGKLIADTVIGWFGGSISLMTLMLIFTGLSVIMGNLMSSSASTAILAPIAIYICQALGYPAQPVIMAIIWSLNLAFLTPVATPPITMTFQGGYRFLDYTKMGAILMVGCLALTIACYLWLI